MNEDWLSALRRAGFARRGALRTSARVPLSETESAPASIIGAIAEVLLQGPGSPGSSDLGNDPAIELIGQEFDVGVIQSVSGRPCDTRIPNRPDLRHQRRDAGRKLPEANDSSSDERTHDVNDEMLAKEYRRGLRVRFENRVRCDSLGFIFGE